MLIITIFLISNSIYNDNPFVSTHSYYNNNFGSKTYLTRNTLQNNSEINAENIELLIVNNE
jgi:hypothetical protein